MRIILTAFLSAIIFCSCQNITGSGNIITQTRNADHFNGVKTSGSIDIELMSGNGSVKVEADDNVMQYIITEVEDGLLNVHYRPNLSFNNTHVKVYVSAPTFNRLLVTGSGTITSKNTIKASNHMETKVSGSGDINAVVDAPSVSADISGSGTINLEGRTKNFDCSIGGSGDIKCSRLLSENVNVSIGGSGAAHVFASVHLVAKVSGSGDIYYSGNPSSPEIHTSGSGSVQAEQ